MTASKRQSILEALKARLETIHARADFLTDAGDAVFLGEQPPFGPDDPAQAIALVSGPEAVRRTGENLIVEWSIQIAALVRADLDEPWVVVESVVADIKRAIEVADRRLGKLLDGNGLERGPVETLERDAGSKSVGAVVTYLAPFSEGWGTP